MWYLFIIFGFLSGIIGAMGMGGGTLLIPLLTIFSNVSQILAQGYNLIAFLPMSVVAIIIHAKNKLIASKYLFWIIPSGIIFAVLGGILANLLDGDILKVLFGIFLIILSIFEFVKIFKK